MKNATLVGLELLPSYGQGAARRVLEKAVRATGLGGWRVTVALVDLPTMVDLNATHRGKAGPTDVLSFPFHGSELEEMAMGGSYLGDLVLCAPVAQRQAKEAGHAFSDELAVLTAHGLLHLLGLDHEKGADEARRQAECELAILDHMGIPAHRALINRTLG